MTGDFDEFDELAGNPATTSAEDEPAPAPLAEPDAGAAGIDHVDAPVTGNQRVDEATALLDGLDDLPTAAHADLFEDVHRRLQGALSDLDGD